jgi:ribosomal-protein-alanine N-acetyltransferase
VKPPDWSLERLRPADIPEVLAIERATFPFPWPGHAFLPDPEAFWARSLVLRDCSRPGSGVRGYVCFWVLEGEMEIQNIAVHPDDRGRGGGRHVMAGAMEDALAADCRHAWLEVRPTNEAAIALYRSWGFEMVGTRKGYYEDGEDALIMRAALNPGRSPAGRPARGLSLKGPRTG